MDWLEDFKRLGLHKDFSREELYKIVFQKRLEIAQSIIAMDKSIKILQYKLNNLKPYHDEEIIKDRLEYEYKTLADLWDDYKFYNDKSYELFFGNGQI